MYKTGDLILYGNTGVCRITDISTSNLSGTDALYYVLQPLYQNCTISTPVDNPKVFMRPIISRDEAEHLIGKIPSIHVEAYHSPIIKQLVEHYETSLQSHDCTDLIELTMSLYAKRQDVLQRNRKFSVVDERFMKRAEELLFGELAAALDITKDEVPAYITTRVGYEAVGMRS